MSVTSDIYHVWIGWFKFFLHPYVIVFSSVTLTLEIYIYACAGCLFHLPGPHVNYFIEYILKLDMHVHSACCSNPVCTLTSVWLFNFKYSNTKKTADWRDSKPRKKQLSQSSLTTSRRAVKPCGRKVHKMPSKFKAAAVKKPEDYNMAIFRHFEELHPFLLCSFNTGRSLA